MKNLVNFSNLVGLGLQKIQYALDELDYIRTVYYDLCGKSGIIPGLTTFRFFAQYIVSHFIL